MKIVENTELIKSHNDSLDEIELVNLIGLMKNNQPIKTGSLFANLKKIIIDAPKNFSENIDNQLYQLKIQ